MGREYLAYRELQAMNEYLLKQVILVIRNIYFLNTNSQYNTGKTGTHSSADTSTVQCSLLWGIYLGKNVQQRENDKQVLKFYEFLLKIFVCKNNFYSELNCSWFIRKIQITYIDRGFNRTRSKVNKLLNRKLLPHLFLFLTKNQQQKLTL